MELENEKYFKDAPVWKSIFVMAVPSVMIEYFGETVPRFRHNEYRRSGRGYRH